MEKFRSLSKVYKKRVCFLWTLVPRSFKVIFQFWISQPLFRRSCTKSKPKRWRFLLINRFWQSENKIFICRIFTLSETRGQNYLSWLMRGNWPKLASLEVLDIQKNSISAKKVYHTDHKFSTVGCFTLISGSKWQNIYWTSTVY